MKKETRVFSLILAVLLLGVSLCPAFAASDTDFSACSFTMTDITRKKTVSFNGGSGKPTVLVFGGFGSCGNTDAYAADLLALLASAESGAPLVYFIDVQSNDTKTILSALGEGPLPANVFVGSRDTMLGSWLSSRILSVLYGENVYSYTMPLVAYLDKTGKMLGGSTASVSRKTIAEELAKIGVALDANAGYVDLPLEVQFLQTEARKELAMVNALRTGKNAWYWNSDNKTKTVFKDLKPLTYDYALEQVAMQRALELAVLYSHSRPDGTGCFSAYDDLGYKHSGAGENIAYGFYEAADVETAWEEADEPFEGQGHRRNILGAFKAFGCACVEYNGVRFWAQEFSGTVNDAEKKPANDARTVGTIRFNAEDLSDWKAEPGSVRIGLGQKQTLADLVHISVAFNGKTLQTALAPVWTSADPSIATVSADGAVTGKAVGDTTLKADMPQKGVSVSIGVTVREKKVDNTPITEPVKEIGYYLYCVPGITPYDLMSHYGPGTGFGLRFVNGEWENSLPETVYTGLQVYPPTGKTYTAIVMGDTDGDGEITASDARIALRIAVGLEDNWTEYATACYVDNEWGGGVTAAQARLILRGAVGLEDPLEWFRAVTPD